jgi:hypothetical protein
LISVTPKRPGPRVALHASSLGFAPPRHGRHGEDEALIILTGDIQVARGKQEWHAGAWPAGVRPVCGYGFGESDR